jgi:hypothetical protein
MTNNIVNVNVSVVAAPAPSQLQNKGAIISVGGTNLAAGTTAILTMAADLTSRLVAPAAITSLAWASSVVTVTTTAAHGIPNGQVVPATIAGATPAGYNGTFQATSTGANTFTYPLVSNPGAETIPGTWVPLAATELSQAVTTFFAQGASQAVYVLELGMNGVTAAVASLVTFLAANPSQFYAFLVPREWDVNAAFLSLIGSWETPTSKLYFFTTTTISNYTQYSAVMKDVFLMVEAPSIGVNEFSCAASFFVAISQQPSPTNKVPPMSYQYLFGVTAYPIAGNAVLFTALKAANVNWVGTGAEGGIANTILFYGTTTDGKDFLKWWYGIDWVQVNADLLLSNYIIQESNDKINPLYYNQSGINRLQGVTASLMSLGISDGIVLGPIVLTQLDQQTFINNVNNGVYANQTPINAVPFTTYTTANPNDYGNEVYNGLTVAMIPQLGFKQITFNLSVSSFVAGTPI